jgi:hypothetical protein
MAGARCTRDVLSRVEGAQLPSLGRLTATAITAIERRDPDATFKQQARHMQLLSASIISNFGATVSARPDSVRQLRKGISVLIAVSWGALIGHGRQRETAYPVLIVKGLSWLLMARFTPYSRAVVA